MKAVIPKLGLLVDRKVIKVVICLYPINMILEIINGKTDLQSQAIFLVYFLHEFVHSRALGIGMLPDFTRHLLGLHNFEDRDLDTSNLDGLRII